MSCASGVYDEVGVRCVVDTQTHMVFDVHHVRSMVEVSAERFVTLLLCCVRDVEFLEERMRIRKDVFLVLL